MDKEPSLSLCFFALVSNAVDTMRFLLSAPNVNVVRMSNKRGQTSGVTQNLVKLAKSFLSVKVDENQTCAGGSPFCFQERRL